MTDYEQMEWSVRVSTSDQQTTSVYARKSRFDVGPPLSFDVEDPRVSAFEYLLGALGADLVAGMKDLCHKRRLEVGSVEALVQGQLDNALAFLNVVGETGHPGLSNLIVKVFVETLEEENVIRQVWDEMLERSPLYNSFSSPVQFKLELQIVM